MNVARQNKLLYLMSCFVKIYDSSVTYSGRGGDSWDGRGEWLWEGFVERVDGGSVMRKDKDERFGQG